MLIVKNELSDLAAVVLNTTYCSQSCRDNSVIDLVDSLH